MKEDIKPWWSIGTLLAVCVLMACKLYHVRFSIPEIAWWAWPLLALAAVALNLGFFLWLAMITMEHNDTKGASHVQAAAGVVFLLVLIL